jgi:hypothetical protein
MGMAKHARPPRRDDAPPTPSLEYMALANRGTKQVHVSSVGYSERQAKDEGRKEAYIQHRRRIASDRYRPGSKRRRQGRPERREGACQRVCEG